MEFAMNRKQVEKLIKESMPHTTVKHWIKESVVVNVDTSRLKKATAGKNEVYKPEAQKNNKPSYVLQNVNKDLRLIIQ